MPEINRNCNIQTLIFNYTYVDKHIFIQCENSEENPRGFQLCRGPGHFNLQIKGIVKLDVSCCNLDVLPDCLEILPLKILDISHNQLTAAPNCIKQGLSSIEELNLSYNMIRNFEDEPRCSCKLRLLNISHNLLKDVPMWIQNVNTINLREFDYSINVMGCTRDAQYKKVASYNLQKAVFSTSKVITANLDFVKSIRTLKYLDLSNENQPLLNVISPLEKLFEKTAWYDTMVVLILNNMNISFLPDNITEIINLKELYLRKNDLFYLPSVIGDLKKLEVLDLSQNNICCLPPFFRKLTELKVLKLQFNQLCDVQEVCELPNLVILDLYHNEVDHFSHNPTVPFLDLEQNIFNTNTLTDYHEKKKLYRSQNSMIHRLDGPIAEIIQEVEAVGCGDDVSFSSSTTEDGEIEHQESLIETESWDDVKVKSNPDITSSDEEWDGRFPYSIPKKKSVVRFGPDCYDLFQDCAEEC